MNRRDFIKSASFAALAGGLASQRGGAFAAEAGSSPATTALATSAPPKSAESDGPLITCDVLVYGSTPSGVAAALHAARGGCKVILACPKKHPGGMLASGMGGLDTRRHDLLSGFVLEYREARFAAMRQLVQAGVPEWQRGIPGKGGAAPSFIEGVFHQMLRAEGERLTYWPGHYVQSTAASGSRLTEVVLEPENKPGTRVRVTAKTFIDGTYEGDLAAAANVPYRVGRESRAELGEPMAGICYFDSKKGREIITPDTGAASPAIQAYCARVVITTDPERRVPFEKPASYEEHLPDLWPLLDDFESGRVKNRSYGVALPGLKWELNGSIDQRTSLDLPGVSWAWPEASREYRRRLERFHIDHAASFFWFLQNEPRMPEHVRAQWKLAGRHRDEFPDNDHWPWQIYVRQGRRIEGRECVTQHTFTVQSATKLTPRCAQPIAIGEFAIDVHACQDRRFAEQGWLEGAIWYRQGIPTTVQPGQISYGAMLPRQLDNLLVPVALCSSHIGMSIVRMEPVWMVTGQVAGLAAAAAQSSGLDVAHIDPVPLTRRAKIITDPGPPQNS